MLYKKRWSDGLNLDFDHLNEFEAKFYCFGGDGGGDSGGGSTSTSKQNKKAAAQEPKRGKQAPPTRQETLNMVNQAARDSWRRVWHTRIGNSVRALPFPSPRPACAPNQARPNDSPITFSNAAPAFSVGHLLRSVGIRRLSPDRLVQPDSLLCRWNTRRACSSCRDHELQMVCFHLEAGSRLIS